ncbi:hypothetical protein EVAR_42069_1 [Eumeta japonica]|uniref:Uncharacterized protein n=1 Tax=Eumeta variegata TaxID=151549 RepID=A0A4C1XVQ5_EUMVA|nr:hypothetical protein EVAR_42069_1 [Eumeta japonica]
MIRGKDKWSKIITQWYPRDGKRKRGRPQKRWDGDIRQVAGKTWRRVARERSEWSRLEEAFANWQTDLQKAIEARFGDRRAVASSHSRRKANILIREGSRRVFANSMFRSYMNRILFVLRVHDCVTGDAASLAHSCLRALARKISSNIVVVESLQPLSPPAVTSQPIPEGSAETLAERIELTCYSTSLLRSPFCARSELSSYYARFCSGHST